MRLGVNLGYWGSLPVDQAALAIRADELGFHSIWTAEAYGSDALTPLAWVGAQTKQIKLGTGIMQMPARTPAATAMAAATLDTLSEGRVLLGIGASGPQVSEGWYGVEYGQPLRRTREYVEIIRRILAREGPLEFDGDDYQVPLKGGTGLGKPLKLITKPLRNDIPIYLAAIGPKNVALAGEIADGWLPVFCSPERFDEVFTPALEEGFAKRTRPRETFDVNATAPLIMADDIDGCRALVKPFLALYIGGMGARGKNFYNDLAQRLGFEAAAKEIQDFYLDGKKTEATAAVPDELVDEIALVGPKERIVDRLAAWRESPVTTLCVSTAQPEALEVLAEAVL